MYVVRQSTQRDKDTDADILLLVSSGLPPASGSLELASLGPEEIDK